jgi:toxin ParE1/3/4
MAVLDRLAERSPKGAASVRDRLVELVTLLEGHPHAGRLTTRTGVRRLAATPYPYLIDYRVAEAEVVVLRLRHGARRDATRRAGE